MNGHCFLNAASCRRRNSRRRRSFLDASRPRTSSMACTRAKPENCVGDPDHYSCFSTCTICGRLCFDTNTLQVGSNTHVGQMLARKSTDCLNRSFDVHCSSLFCRYLRQRPPENVKIATEITRRPGNSFHHLRTNAFGGALPFAHAPARWHAQDTEQHDHDHVDTDLSRSPAHRSRDRI